MSNFCSICLCAFEDPVSIPCGHIYCSSCLYDYISGAAGDGYSASCPTCRAGFPIVSPELTYIPKPFRRFILPSIRRVYVDDTPTPTDLNNLRAQLDGAQTQIDNLKKESEKLMTSCERYMARMQAHQEGEREANKEVERLKRQLRQEQKRAEVAEREVERWRERYVDVKEELDESESRRKWQTQYNPGRGVLPPKRTIDGLSLSDDGEEDTTTPIPLTPRRRVIRGLPQHRPNKKLKPVPGFEGERWYVTDGDS